MDYTVSSFRLLHRFLLRIAIRLGQRPPKHAEKLFVLSGQTLFAVTQWLHLHKTGQHTVEVIQQYRLAHALSDRRPRAEGPRDRTRTR